MKKIIYIILTYIIFAGSVHAFEITYDGKTEEYNELPIYLNIEDKIIEGDVPPIMLNGRTLVPAREVFEALGAELKWLEDYNQLYVGYEEKLIILEIGKDYAIVDDKEVKMEAGPKIINGKTMIPVRFVAEALHFKVAWEDPTRIITITKKGEVAENEIIDTSTIEMEVKKEEVKKPSKEVVFEEKLDDYIEEYKNKFEDVNYKDVNFEKMEIIDDKFIISFDDAISSVEDIYWDGHIIIDVKNSKIDEDTKDIELENNKYVKKIRFSQFETNPNITRIVFDMKETMNYKLILSGDRKDILVSLEKNIINKVVVLKTEENKDLVRISGLMKPDVNVSRLTNPERLVIDVKNSVNLIGYKEKQINYNIIKNVKTSQFDEKTTRIVLEIEDQADYYINEKNLEVAIEVFETKLNKITYENGKDATIKLKKNGKKINLEDVIIRNDYINKKCNIILPGDYTETFNEGKLQVKDENINRVDVSKNANGNTQILITENKILEYILMEDEQYVYISAKKPRDIYENIVVLDAGHGGRDSGASKNGLLEKEINLDVTLKVYELFKNNRNVKVYLTRDDDAFPALAERIGMANDLGADYFVSIHNNATVSSAWNGTEVLYYGPNSSLNAKSKNLASRIQNALVARTNTKDRGIKLRKELHVLRNSKVPAVITEIAYLTNGSDAAKLKTQSFRQKAAQGIYEGILEGIK